MKDDTKKEIRRLRQVENDLVDVLEGTQDRGDMQPEYHRAERLMLQTKLKRINLEMQEDI